MEMMSVRPVRRSNSLQCENRNKMNEFEFRWTKYMKSYSEISPGTITNHHESRHGNVKANSFRVGIAIKSFSRQQVLRIVRQRCHHDKKRN